MFRQFPKAYGSKSSTQWRIWRHYSACLSLQLHSVIQQVQMIDGMSTGHPGHRVLGKLQRVVRFGWDLIREAFFQPRSQGHKRKIGPQLCSVSCREGAVFLGMNLHFCHTRDLTAPLPQPLHLSLVRSLWHTWKFYFGGSGDSKQFPS